MSDTFYYCGCQYEPDEEFQKEHWHEIELTEGEKLDWGETGIHCDLCDSDVRSETIEYGLDF